MRRFFLLVLVVLSCFVCNAQWEPKGNQIKTVWAGQVNPESVLPEYPRPIQVRSEWKNLNGLWDYTVLPNTMTSPNRFDGKILVPFAIESSLSGVQQKLGPDKALWYKRSFTVPSGWNNKRVLLHFGAVDWKTEVWVNDIMVGEHTGGYDPFYFDITEAIQRGKENTLLVRVDDPSSTGWQPRGKQSERPWLLWYTTVSGIWQTVWMEPVPENYIKNVRTTPDIDRGILTVQVCADNNDRIVSEVKVFDQGKLVASGKSVNGLPVHVAIPDAKLWSPESPFLYDVEVSIIQSGKKVDVIKSYAAMRKFSTKMGDDHIIRLQLNNKDYFQFGTLDQGYWPDGLYTAPTDEALLYDIKKTKEFGYNLIRKHIKVEPARWYTHCDREGIIVWQDMPSGDETPEFQWRDFFTGKDLVRSPESEKNFRKEWKAILDALYSYPCIGTWVVFNEGWGQFKTIELAKWTKEYDPSRLVDAASGGNHYHEGGDMLDLHNYPEPQMYLFDAKRANVLGEYGGIGYKNDEHTWETDKLNVPAKTGGLKEATDKYEEYANILKKLIDRGYTAAIYTQITDIEGELNGLMTYDRAVIKLDAERVRRINQEICNSFLEKE